MYPWLEDAIRRDATVISANRRLARELRSAYAARRIEAGKLSWLTPSIHSLDDWCREQLEACAAAKFPQTTIDDFSSSILWDRCLRAHAPEGMPGFRGFLRLARDAWQKICDWNVPLAAVAESARSPDEQLFAMAAADYRALLDTACWIDRPGMTSLVVELLSTHALAAPAEIVLAGFDRLAPAVTRLLDTLALGGCVVTWPPQPQTDARVRLASFEDHDAELRAAGAWARDVLQSEPGASIAIISPTLQDAAARKARLVREGLAPGWQYGLDAHSDAVNVSYGRKLGDFPAVAVALLLLKWLSSGLSTKDVSLLLRSRCLLAARAPGRSRLELALRQLPDRSWSPTDLKRVLDGKEDSPDALAFMHGVDALIDMQTEAQREAAPDHWASRIDSLLDRWHWPGETELSSDEFQLVNRWRDLLNEFARSSIVMPVLRLGEAVERIAMLADDVIFQPESETGLASLMGPLEAAGMHFDHLWVGGLHAGQWPPSGAPSALLSRALQRAFGMPDATPADTLFYARRVLRRLAGSARDVVLSWPKSDGESELAASSLLDEIVRDPIVRDPIVRDRLVEINDPGWHAVDYLGTGNTRVIAMDPVPRVAHDEIIRNGAYTVQRQTVEPFAAFVYGRLGIKPPDAIEAGIAPRIRGTIMHAALHTLLAGRPSQKDMQGWSDKDLEERLGSAIDAALAGPLRHADATVTRLLGLERRRLFLLLRAFIAAELGRAAFAVLEVEKSIEFEAFGVRLDLRIDRIDRLADGSLLIVDYKTGRPRSLLNRHGEPTDLQLVVYADALDDVIGGLVFINVDSRSISYKGTGGSVEWDAMPADTWAERLESWIAGMRRALEAFAAGDVRVNLLLTAEEGRPLGLLSRLEELKRAD